MTSPAGAASGAQSGEAAQQNGQGEGQAAQGPDLSALADQLGQMSQGQEEMRQFLQSQPWTQQTETNGDGEQAPEEGMDLSFLDDAGYDTQAATQLADMFQQQVQTQVEAAKREWQKDHQALTERVSERERMEQMRDLVDEFPDMADPEIAKPVVAQAHSLVEANGWPEQLAADPRFWRIAYAAQQAFEAAESEGSEDSAAAHLEGGAGAASATATSQADQFKQMLDNEAKGGRNALPFP